MLVLLPPHLRIVLVLCPPYLRFVLVLLSPPLSKDCVSTSVPPIKGLSKCLCPPYKNYGSIFVPSHTTNYVILKLAISWKTFRSYSASRSCNTNYQTFGWSEFDTAQHHTELKEDIRRHPKYKDYWGSGGVGCRA